MTPWFKHHSEVSDQEWPWPNFTPKEMADRKSGELLIDPNFMNWLQTVREEYALPMHITSGYRTPEHQQLLPGGRISGAHVDAMAVDVKVYGWHAHKLISVACDLGAFGIGVHQHGNYRNRYLHLDRWTKSPENTRPMLWSY